VQTAALTACPTCGAGRISDLDATVEGKAKVSGCKSCGLVFINPMPTDEELAAHYAPGGAWSRKRERGKGGQEERRRMKAARRTPDSPKPWIPDAANELYQQGARHVLDVGCEDGSILDKLQDRGWVTTGVDPNTRDTITRHRMLGAIPDEPGFDLIIMQHVLEHLRDPVAVLKQARRALNEDGRLFVGVPTLDGLASHRKKNYCINRQHVTAYTARSLRNLLGLAGFAIERRMRANAPYRMSFICRPMAGSSRVRWPLRDAQIAFRELAYQERGWRGLLGRGAAAAPASNKKKRRKRSFSPRTLARKLARRLTGRSTGRL
jgi:SAM-dependent methyltransferase